MVDLTTLRKCWAFLDAHERINALKVISVAILSAFASTAMVGSVMPFLSVLSEPARISESPQLSWAYDRFGFASPYDFLVALGIGALVVIFFAMLVQALKVYTLSRFSMMRVHSISCRLLARYLSQPYEYFLNHHSGEMGTRVLAEAAQVVNYYVKPMTELITSALTVTALMGFLIWVEPFIALASFIALGSIYGGTYVLARTRLNRLGQERVVANAERYRLATEALGGVKVIKLLGRERAYVDRFRRPSGRMATAQVRTQVISQIPHQVIQALAFGGVVILCLILLEPRDFDDGAALETILPILGVFAFAGQRLMPELSKLYQSAAQIKAGKASVDVVYSDLIGEPAAPIPRQTPTSVGLKKTLELDSITYTYPNMDHAGAFDITLKIQVGERIGIVGGTGAGKTTLADIILGLLRPQAGKIIADQTPITESNLRAWQQTVGYVPQDIFLIDASIAENIALGVSPDEINIDEVTRSARIANIDTFIQESLPDGYSTTVGERGVRLSGGQRQRIGIARAIYHNADLIVFDEATSALDNATEAEVMDAIEGLAGDKTVVMIAHRLSTVKRCDRIVVMETGHMVGCDSWHALMANNPVFQRIAQETEQGENLN